MRTFLAWISAIIVFTIVLFLVVVLEGMAGFKPHYLGGILGTVYVYGRGLAAFWVGRKIYRRIKYGRENLHPGMRDVKRELNSLVQSNPAAVSVLPQIHESLRSHQRGILAQLQHGKTTPQEVALKFFTSAFPADVQQPQMP